MKPLISLAAAAVGYLLGSLSFARIVAHRVAPDVDISAGVDLTIEETGETVHVDGVAGTVAAKRLGDRYGCLVGIADILKSFLPALGFRLAFPDDATPYYLIAAFTAIGGHNWPIYHRFKGGTGLSPIVGGFLVLDPIGTIVTSIAALILGLVVVRGPFGVYFAYSGMVLLMAPWVWFGTHDPARLLYVVGAIVFYLAGSIPALRTMIERKRSGARDIDTAAILAMLPMGRGLERMKGWLRTRQRREAEGSALHKD